LPGITDASTNPFPDHFAFKLRHRCQDVEHQAGCGIGFISIDILADGKEPDTMIIFVVKDGRIAECGNHEALLKKADFMVTCMRYSSGKRACRAKRADIVRRGSCLTLRKRIDRH